MNDKFRKFKAFIRNHIWADFLFTFILFLLINIIQDLFSKNTDVQLQEILIESFWFSIILTPIFRLLRPMEDGIDLYEFVDHVRYYKIGQQGEIIKFLESKGYKVDYIEGNVTYFISDQDTILKTSKTFVHKTDHWISLVANPSTLDEVPSKIKSIYPKA